VIALVWTAVAAAPFFTVDLQEAVLATDDGRQAKARLERAVREASTSARERRNRLLSRRSSLSAEAFEAARRRANRRIDRAEERLEDLQTELLAPILARLRRGVEAIGRERGGFVLDVASDRVAGQPVACDLTDEVVARYAERTPESTGGSAPEACRPRVVARVDRGRAVRGTPTSKEIVAARDAFRARQADELARLDRDDVRRAQQIRRRVEARDEAARRALGAAVHRAMKALARRHPNTVWVAVEPQRLDGLARGSVCDGTPRVRAELGDPNAGASDCSLAPNASNRRPGLVETGTHGVRIDR